MEKTKKAELTRRSILKASVKVIAGQGIEKASITVIAEEADVSRGLVAHYFPDKDLLFEEVIRFITEEGYAFFQQSKTEFEREGEHGAISRIRFNFSFFFANPDYFRCFILMYYYSTFHERMRKMNTKISEGAISYFEPLVNSRRDAVVLYRDMIAAVQAYFIFDHDMTEKEYIDFSIRSLQQRLDNQELALE